MDTLPVPKLPPTRDWSELPLDALVLVFAKLGAVEVLMGAGIVCHSWLEAAKVPDLWRSVDMVRHKVVLEKDTNVLCAMARVAVDRSDGQLEVFGGKEFVTDELLKYIAERSSSLKSLSLVRCYDVSNEGFTDLIRMSPLLEDLVLSQCRNVGGDVYEVTGKACAQLKRLELRKYFSSWIMSGEALRIVTMHELRCLTLDCCDITNEELSAVLDSCHHLELLDVRRCFNIVVDDALQSKCARIKTLRLIPDGEPLGEGNEGDLLVEYDSSLDSDNEGDLYGDYRGSGFDYDVDSEVYDDDYGDPSSCIFGVYDEDVLD